MRKHSEYPSHWKRKLLDDVAIRGTGHTPSQSYPEYWDGDIKWVSLADSSLLDKLFIYTTSKKISLLGIKKSSAVIHPKGTVLLSRDAGVGKSAIMAEDMAVSQHFITWNCSIPSQELYNVFLYYWLQSMKPEFERMAIGSTVKTIGLPYFTKLMISFPPLKEQIAISNMLSICDLVIEKTRKLIDVKEAKYKWLQQQLIIKSSQNNKNWRQCRICDIADRIQRKSNGAEYPILTISSSAGFVLQEEKYSRFMAGKSVEDYILIQRGEFAYNKGNSLRFQFGCIFELKDYDEALVPHVYVCFKLHNEVNPDYLGHVFAADYLKRQLGALVKTGVRNNGLLNIRPEEFMSVTVPIPPAHKQAFIAEILNTARQEINLLKKQVEAYRKLKRGLMQKLLTGQWRVKADQEELL